MRIDYQACEVERTSADIERVIDFGPVFAGIIRNKQSGVVLGFDNAIKAARFGWSHGHANSSQIAIAKTLADWMPRRTAIC